MRDGWTVRSLDEVCEIKPPKREARNRLEAHDPVSFVPMNDLGIREKWLLPKDERPLSSVAGGYTYFADGDVLIAKITPCFENGKLGIARGLTNGVGFGSSEFVVLRPDEALDAEFLFYFLSQDSFRDAGFRVMSGAVGHKRVPKEYIQHTALPLPPRPEQKRIVAMLDEAFAGIDAAIANTEKNLANARELFESYLNAVFSQRGDGWTERPLETLVHETCSLSYGIVQPGADVSGGLPVVRPTDLTGKVIRLHKLKTIDPSLARPYSRTTLQGGDLLLCVRGTTGVVSIAARELEGANVTRGIVPIRFNSSLVGQELGYHLLRSPNVQEQIAEKTYGAALMQINIRDVRKIRIPVPPRDTHDELRASLDDLSAEADRLKLVYIQKLTALSELKQSLLQKAFSGELTAGKVASDAMHQVEEIA